MELRPEDIQEILRIFDESNLVELRLEIGGNRLHVSKVAGGTPSLAGPAPAAPTPSAPAPAAPSSTSVPGSAPADEPVDDAPAPQVDASAPRGDSGWVELRSPLLGVFYRRPAPDQAAFVEIGSEVGPDDAVCIIDVMKMFTRVPAGTAGRIMEICVEDGTLVEHGQVLMRIEPR